ncbi:hypothetical protein D081_0847 [Anaerovibrio sp. JC8]|uniref:DUF445 domain-containing protein n=1 Tax=Anaerovibrio sp. JC8 TaxID=1240085 RepID=UPI000A0E2844|nr:DUF445 domain-containing protein [Anaerovibrio sp. JC8]ORU00324.1 hypothetical protein D081_0847 [Anaerovibrio sp. JC8]
MIWKNWNKADKTLLGAAAIFFFTLCLHIEYPDNLFAKGLLFCAEAALVGGIADWFAVTALFKKPLGFPYHTAILPRRREAFVEATGKMLQKEFFSKKKLLNKAKSIDYSARIMEWLTLEENRDKAAKWLQTLLAENINGIKILAANKLDEWLNSPAMGEKLMEELGRGTENSDVVERLADEFIKGAGRYVSQDGFKQVLGDYLDNYIEGKLDNPMAKMMMAGAQSSNLVNVEEAAELTQQQAVKLLEQLATNGSHERQAVLASLTEVVKKTLNNFELKQEFSTTWSKTKEETFYVRNSVAKIDFVGGSEEGKIMYWLARLLIDTFWKLLENKTGINDFVNDTVYGITGRGALQAQEMLGDISRDVLGSLTDDQMNHLIYDKAEPDLLWIRMNGSIVGAIIGLCIFSISCIFI